MDNNSFHLVVRFSDKMFDVGDVIARHNEVVSRYGYVWFGKMGNTITARRVELLNRQIELNMPTFLYLAQGGRNNRRFYRAKLMAIAKELSTQEKRFIPTYYSEKNLLEYISVWMKIGEIVPIQTSEMPKLRTVNSALTLDETLARSTAGYFMVHEITRKQFA